MLKRPKFSGDIRNLPEYEWTCLNMILLRERWRDLCDSTLHVGMPFPEEPDFYLFCTMQYDVEKEVQRHEWEAP